MDTTSRLDGSGGISPDANGSGISVSAFVNASGQSVGVQFLDANGHPTNITTLSLTSGLQPVLRRNGASISGLQWTYARSIFAEGQSPQTPYSPEATAWLPQSSPASKYYTFGAGVFEQGGYYWNNNLVPSGANYSGNPQATTETGDSITFICDGFLPGTYQLAMTWVPDSTLANNAAVTIHTISNGILDTAITAITLNQSVTPTDFNLGGVAWKILQSFTIAWPTTGFQFKLSNPGGKVAFDALQIARTSADQSVTIAPGDVLSLDLPYAWATCEAGAVVGPSGVAPSFADASFETPVAADFGSYNPSGTAWTFSGAAPATQGGYPQTTANGSGVAKYPSGFLYNGITYNIPDGNQVGFLQGAASFSQTVAGFAAGSYSVNFQASYRWNDQNPPTISVAIDGTVIASFTPPGNSNEIFYGYTTPPFTVSAGSHTITFSTPAATDPDGSLRTALIDEVSIATATGITGIPVANNVGQSALGRPNTNQTTTLPLGYNVIPEMATFSPGLLLSNIAPRVDFTVLSGAVLNDLNYVVLYNQPSVSQIGVAFPGINYPYATRFGMNGVPNGKWTIQWDGTDVYSFKALGPVTVTEDTSHQILGQTTGNRRVYNVQAVTNQVISPSIFLSVATAATTANGQGQYAYESSNLSIVPPNPSDPTGLTPWLSGVPKWYPTTVGWMAGSQILRNMDWMNTNSCATGTYADLRVPGALNGPGRLINPTIQTISNVTGSAFFAQVKYVSFQVSFTTPHQLFDSAFISLTPAQQLNYSDGSNDPAGQAMTGFVHVIDASTIEFMHLLKSTNGTPVTLTGTTSGGSISLSTGGGGAWLDFIDLCSLNHSTMHCNIPIGCNDACITQMAVDCAARLTQGLKIHLEWSNEHWNYYFPAYHWLLSKSYAMTGSLASPTPAYVAGASHAHSVFLTAWVGAGRNASDVVRVMGSQGGYSGVTSNIITAATTQGVTFDQIDVSCYLSNSSSYGPEVTFQQIFDGMTNGQVLDYFDWNLRYGKYERLLLEHSALLEAAGLTSVKVGCYEAGMQSILPGNSVVNGFERSYDAINHPRTFGQQFYFQQLMQDVAQASSVAIYYLLGGGLINNNSGLIQGSPYLWSTYVGYNQSSGTGNPSLDPVNLNNPLTFNHIKSEVGGAIALWNALRSGPVASTPSSVPPQQRTIGRKPIRHHGN